MLHSHHFMIAYFSGLELVQWPVQQCLFMGENFHKSNDSLVQTQCLFCCSFSIG